AQAASLAAEVREGALLCLRDESGTLVGGCLLGTRPYGPWRGRPGEAAYLQRLVVARAVAGRGWGARVVEHAQRWAGAQGRALLRLDCWEGNAVLRAYYRGLGFVELDTVPQDGHRVRLFERVVAGP
ncbi:MAG: GNAT family N-acetyltransferase, partial [Planctomycetota bacterium]|nr:GNAT family N-acetyltransferase [Planctomycetota bacterium]